MVEFQSTAIITSEVQLFVSFPGRPAEIMPQLLDSKPKRNPLTLGRILELRTTENPDQEQFRINYFTTSDQAIKDPNSLETKIVWYEHPEAQRLARELRSTDQLVEWSFPVNNDTYHGLEGDMVHVIPDGVVRDLLNDSYSRPKERQKFWEFAARGDSDRFTANLKIQTDQGRTIKNCMGLYLTDVAGMRLVWLGSVGGSDSDAGSDDDLSYTLGRLVGELAPEVLAGSPQATQKNMEISYNKVTSAAWEYLKRTPATDIRRKGLSEEIKTACNK